MNKIRIDEDRFIWFGDYRLPIKYIPERDTMQFCDFDRRRIMERGSRMVEVPLDAIQNLRKAFGLDK
jgi:hypothetical protein